MWYKHDFYYRYPAINLRTKKLLGNALIPMELRIKSMSLTQNLYANIILMRYSIRAFLVEEGNLIAKFGSFLSIAINSLICI